MAIDNTITFAKGTSAPSGSTEAVIGQPLFHYATDGSVANLYIGFDTDDGDNKWVGAPILDQDNMSSNSATSLATQQSIVAYVAAQITAEDMDITSDSGTIDIDLNSETLDIAGGSGITTSASGTTVTVAGDNASTSAKGVASFSSTDFDVSSGAVSIKDNSITLAYLAGGTDGNIISYDTSGDPVAVATGSDGQVLTSAGSGQPPAFETPSSAAISTYSNASNNRVLTSVDSTSVNAESNMTYDGTVLTITDAAGSDTLLSLKSTDADAGDAPRMDLVRDSATPATNDEIGRIRFNANQASGALKTYAGIEAEIKATTNSAHDGRLNFEVAVDGTVTSIVTIDKGGMNLVSASDDYEINNTNVLDATTLGTGVVTSSLTTVGTIASGIWQGTPIANGYLANDSVDSAAMADDSIDSAAYVDASIDLAHMSANSIDSTQYVDGSIDDAHLSDGVATGLAGAGTTASSGVLNVIGGDGITANANDIAVTAAQTTITSVLSDSLKIGRADGQDSIDFGSDDTILFDVDNTERMRVDAAGVDITGNLTVTGDTTVVNILAGAASNTIQFEGTADGYETTLTVVDPTADRTISLPNETGTVLTTASTIDIGDNTNLAGGTNCTLSGDTINVDDAFLKNDASDTTSGTITAGGFTTTGTWTMDEADSGTVGITTIQDSGSAFDDSNTQIMTAAAIADKIEAYSYTTATGDITGVTAGTGLSGGGSSGGVTLNVEASQTQITSVGTIGTGGWEGTAVASAYLDSDTAHLSTTQTFSGAKTFSSLASFTMDGNTITGVDDSGEFTDDDAHMMTSAAVQDKILGYGYTTATGDITGVTAGVGLSGGGASGGVTITLDLSELSAVTPLVGDWLATLDSDGAVEQLTLISALDTLLSATVKTLTNKTISGGTY